MQELAKNLGINKTEYNKIVNLLKREPTKLELFVFSVMWSEHCSYKSSWKLLEKFRETLNSSPFDLGEENSGAIPLDEETLLFFKMESHNHPSAVEPFSGAATGVGGILRDIFTTGAYPVAILNSLRFGNISEKTEFYLKNIVEGIAAYGNAFGVANVGGEMSFNNDYYNLPIVNVLALGTVKKNEVITNKIKTAGESLILVGKITGSDGILGASFASKNLEQQEEAIQKPDPLKGKSLLSAITEAKRFISAMQDLGAGGIISSAIEMAHKSKLGIKINLDKIPTTTEMPPEKILVAETQERMLITTNPENVETIKNIFNKWYLSAEEIGKVIDERKIVVKKDTETLLNLPTDFFITEAPKYILPKKQRRKKTKDYYEIKVPSLQEAIELVISNPNVADKFPVISQYDNRVGLTNAGANIYTTASVVYDWLSGKFIAVSVDANPRWCKADAYIGTKLSLLEAIKNIICSGATPRAITNCLNFGNPTNPEVYYDFDKSVEAIYEIAKKYNLEIVSGNVSFYNQIGNKPIPPTPTIGIVGTYENKKQIRTYNFALGDAIFLLGKRNNLSLNSSLLLESIEINDSNAPIMNETEDFKIIRALIELNNLNIITTANDISEGGLITTLLESVFPTNFGLELNFNYPEVPFLFSEDSGRIVVSVQEKKAQELERFLSERKIPHIIIGKVIPEDVLIINGKKTGSVRKLSESYRDTFKNIRRRLYKC